jgi:hypothetical protein
MESVALVGIKPSEMYEMTPREIENYVNGQIRRLELEQEISITNAWLSAGLERQKRIPRLEELIEKKNKETQSDSQMLAMVKALNDALGGEVIET